MVEIVEVQSFTLTAKSPIPSQVSKASVKYEPTSDASLYESPGPGSPPPEMVGAPPSKDKATSTVYPLFVTLVARGWKGENVQ